jgi:hypothetical protein
VTREQLEHAIRAACDIADDTEVWVFGSQAILGSFPDAPAPLLVSEEADLTPKHRPELTDRVDALLGQDSLFHQTHGFYVHGVPITEAAILPPGWEQRTVRVQNPNTRGHIGWCLEAHDLAASKLAAFRDKDRDFVALLVTEGLISRAVLAARVAGLPLATEELDRRRRWLGAL